MLVIVAACSGAAAGVVYLYATTWIQVRWEPAMHGRIFAMLEAASALAAPVSYLVVGGLLELAGSRGRWILFAIAGAAAIAWGVWVFLMLHSRVSGLSRPVQ
jgi:hypothetical protein